MNEPERVSLKSIVKQHVWPNFGTWEEQVQFYNTVLATSAVVLWKRTRRENCHFLKKLQNLILTCFKMSLREIFWKKYFLAESIFSIVTQQLAYKWHFKNKIFETYVHLSMPFPRKRTTNRKCGKMLSSMTVFGEISKNIWAIFQSLIKVWQPFKPTFEI